MARGRLSYFLFTVGIVIATLQGCGSSSSEEVAQAPECALEVQRFKELMIVDEAVVGDSRSSNTQGGVWSFRYLIEQMTPEGTSPSDFLQTWFDGWGSTKDVNGFAVDREPRQDGMRERLVCPWLRRTTENECNETCTTCRGRVLDPAKAPFRLRAIVYRPDLGVKSNAVSPAGEGRFVFALTSGAADDPSSQALALSMIFEFALPKSRSAKDWAAAWHKLGTYASFDESYKAELAQVTNAFTSRNASPERMNGSALGQVRTNESVFNWIWQLRQFEIDATGQLRLAPVTNTPGEPLNNSSRLRDFVLANAEKIKNDDHVLPRSMLGGSADQLLYTWTIPDVDEKTRAAFSRGTCNGCHSTDTTAVDTVFHISPYRTGIEKLSPFVHNPADTKNDDLSVREKRVRTLLCNP